MISCNYTSLDSIQKHYIVVHIIPPCQTRHLKNSSLEYSSHAIHIACFQKIPITPSPSPQYIFLLPPPIPHPSGNSSVAPYFSLKTVARVERLQILDIFIIFRRRVIPNGKHIGTLGNIDLRQVHEPQLLLRTMSESIIRLLLQKNHTKCIFVKVKTLMQAQTRSLQGVS